MSVPIQIKCWSCEELKEQNAKLEAEAQALREEVARGEQHRNDQADLIVSLRTEVAAMRLELEGCQNVKEQLAAIFRCADEPRWKWIVLHAQQDAEELEALRARVVVVPDERKSFEARMRLSGFSGLGREADDNYTSIHVAMRWRGWQARARLNGKAVSEGLLRRIAAPRPSSISEEHAWRLAQGKALEELRALLDGEPT